MVKVPVVTTLPAALPLTVPHDGGGDHGGLGGPALHFSCCNQREINEQFAGAGVDHQGAKEDKQEDVAGHHAHRGAEDTLGGGEDPVHDTLQGAGRSVQEAREIVGECGVGQEEEAEDHHDLTHGAAGGLQHQHNKDSPHDDVHLIQHTGPVLESCDVGEDVHRHH